MFRSFTVLLHQWFVTVFMSRLKCTSNHSVILDRSVTLILHEELRFHPYKMAVVQQLVERDFNARQTACESLPEDVPPDTLVFFIDEAHFTFLVAWISKTCAIWVETTHGNFMGTPLHCERITVFVRLCGFLKSRPPRRTLVPPSTNAWKSLNWGETKLLDVPFPMIPTLPYPVVTYASTALTLWGWYIYEI